MSDATIQQIKAALRTIYDPNAPQDARTQANQVWIFKIYSFRFPSELPFKHCGQFHRLPRLNFDFILPYFQSL